MANEMIVGANEGLIQRASAGAGLSVFSSAESFGLACRMADALARSTIVPATYQGNPSNCLIAIEMASRINTSPMMVMQNLYIVHGNPAWSSQWIIAMINNSRRYKTELKFDMEYDNSGKPLSCRAWAEDYNGNKVTGPLITMEMANAEGWTKKNGSKWATMPEVMIRYRAASFFGRLNCPDMIMGIYSQEEVVDAFEDPVGGNAAPVATMQAPLSEDDRKITQEERKMFMNAIAEGFKENNERNAVYKDILTQLGLRTSEAMTIGQLGQAMEMVASMAEEKNREVSDEEAKAPEEGRIVAEETQEE